MKSLLSLSQISWTDDAKGRPLPVYGALLKGTILPG